MSTFSNNSARADVSDPNDLPTVMATWPEKWQDSFAEREAIMATDASHPYVPAIREAFKDVVRVAERTGCQLSGL
jgi:hypothetical protein